MGHIQPSSKEGESYKIRSVPILFHDIVSCQLQVTPLTIIILEETKKIIMLDSCAEIMSLTL